MVNVLYVRLNLNNSTLKPYRKANNEPVYIGMQSNHPHKFPTQILKIINRSMWKLSSSKEIYADLTPLNETAPKKVDIGNHLCKSLQTHNIKLLNDKNSK